LLITVTVHGYTGLRTRAIPERFYGIDSLRRGAISSMHLYLLPLPLLASCIYMA